MPRYQCPECDCWVTRGPSGTEYGHARYSNGSNRGGRCSRRPDSVDPVRTHDQHPFRGGESA